MRRSLRLIPIVILAAQAGCSRSYYREAADADVYPILSDRITDPAFNPGRTRVEPDPQSRLADPALPDCPPKPPDDLAAAAYMTCPDGHRGYRYWERFGVSDSIEPLGWESSLGLSERGVLKLTPERATEIAYLNSREYQTRVENLYLTALNLTLNRFEFDTQWFGRTGTNYAHIGSGGPPGETSTLSQVSNLGFSRNFATGGQLLVDFANSFVWEFTGQSRSVSTSLGGTLVQPLLRGFGRNVRLETLTQGERDTLYAVRDFVRFRKQFWSGINVDSGGYLQLLRQLQSIRNAKANLRSQEENYALYQVLFQGGRTEVTNVDQVYQGLLSARLDVIASEIELENQLDRYKLQLGLPPRLKIELDDSKLDQFRLTDARIDQLREEIDAFERARKAELDRVPELASLQTSFQQLDRFLDPAARAIDDAEAALKAWAEDLAKPVPLESREQQGRAKAAYELQKDKPKDLRTRLDSLRSALPAQKSALTEATREAGWKQIIAAVREAAEIVDAAITAGSQARIYQIKLPEIEIAEEQALEFARSHRLDLQNAQAQVTDAWRKISVAANALQSDLTLRVNGVLGTDPDRLNPLAFGAEGSRVSVGLQFDGPLNRLAERNAYRRSLIAYQRSRRDYMQLADTIELEIRTSLRELRRQRLNFEIARQQLLVAVRQLAIERRLLTKPVTQQDRQSDSSAATLRILNAQRSLLAARNGLADSFFGYEQQRIRFLISLEAFTLDERGTPTDDAAASPIAVGNRIAAPE